MGWAPTNLHITDNMEALDKVATHNTNMTNNYNLLLRSANRLMNELNLEKYDEEKAYIVARRCLILFNKARKASDDKKYFSIRYDSDCNKVQKRLDVLKESLIKRYDELQMQNTAAKKPKLDLPKKPHVHRKIFENEYVTSKEIYKALTAYGHNMLFVDIRPEKDYKNSTLTVKNIINIPENLIVAGLSANTLGEKLSQEIQAIWDKRDSFSVIVLFDWDSGADEMHFSKLKQLRSFLVEWDLNRKYNNEPVALVGGFKDFLDTYPAMVNNSHVYLIRKNDELDELLQLDDVQYPVDNEVASENSVPDIVFKGTPTPSAEDIFAPVKFEAETPSEINEQPTKPVKPNIAIIKPYKPDENYVSDPTIDKTKDTTFDLNKIKDAIESDRLKELGKARALKPAISSGSIAEGAIDDISTGDLPSSGDRSVSASRPGSRQNGGAYAGYTNGVNGNEVTDENSFDPLSLSMTPSVPYINRDIKPTRPKTRGNGLVGLKNIKNTCYMNCILQALRSLPAIKTFYVHGRYENYLTRSPTLITHELVGVFRKLWEESNTSITPREFYEKVGELDPVYSKGNHEDCMEFFLFLINKLNDDCIVEMHKPSVMTWQEKSWFALLQGQTSLVVKCFYHMLRNIKTCDICKTRTEMFEMDNTLMLAVKEYECNIDNLIYEYLNPFGITDYCCSKCKRPLNIKKILVHEPDCMVIYLKRFRHVNSGDLMNLEKNNNKVNFKTDIKIYKANYKLYAIAMHQGTLNAGHYTAACLINDKWYEFNDEFVTPFNIHSEHVKSLVTAFFYSRV